MSNVLAVRARNPSDGISTYDKIKFYRATSQTGTYSLIATQDIDQTTISDNSPGYTKYDEASGTTSMWYKVSFYNSSSGIESNLSDAFQGGTTQLDTMIRRKMKDNNASNYFFENEEVEDARELAIKSLYPGTWIDTTYDVTITESNKKTITLPSYIARVDDIMVYNDDGDYIGTYLAFKRVGNKLFALSEFPTGYVFRLIITKPYKLAAECPEEFDDYLIWVSQRTLFESMESDRSRYFKYTSVVRPEGSNMPSLNRIIERLEVQIRRRLNELRRVREATEINLV